VRRGLAGVRDEFTKMTIRVGKIRVGAVESS
jgi:hypothetical protein